MKKKIGEIYNKPIVIGDKNLMTKNEVHKDEISGGSKEYDDLNTYLYYDDRIINIDGIEMPLCVLVARMIINLHTVITTHSIVKMSNTEDIFGTNRGNYIPLDALFSIGSGDSSVVYLFKAISIPKYILPEVAVDMSGMPLHAEKIHIFDLIKLVFGDAEVGYIVEVLKTQPTITREEFFDLLK